MKRVLLWAVRALSLWTLTVVFVFLCNLEQVVPWAQIAPLLHPPQLLLCAFVAVNLWCKPPVCLYAILLCSGLQASVTQSFSAWLPALYLLLFWRMLAYKRDLRRASFGGCLRWSVLAVVGYRLPYLVQYFAQIDWKTAIQAVGLELFSTGILALPVYLFVFAITVPIREEYN